jgi:hypothetical protein
MAGIAKATNSSVGISTFARICIFTRFPHFKEIATSIQRIKYILFSQCVDST